MVSFIPPSLWRCSRHSLVGVVDNLRRIFIPHCWINNGQTREYAFMLKVWVAFSSFFYLSFLFVWFGIISNQGIANWALGDLYWWSISVEIIKQVSKRLFFVPCPFFGGDYFYWGPRDYIWIVQIWEPCWEIVIEKLIGDKTALCLWINASHFWWWNYN